MKGGRQTPNLRGHRFGRLVVDAFAGVVEHRARWLCRCDCGTVRVVMAQALRSGNTKSCGCLFTDARKVSRPITHGRSGSYEHRIWLGIRKRCLNPNAEVYPRYGGRGIRLCERWQRFENFLADMGSAPDGFEIDRIDVDGHYEPNNCRWASLREQANNKRNNRLVQFDGEFLTIAEVAEREGIKYSTAYYRYVVAAESPARRRDDLARDHLNQLRHSDQLVFEDDE